MYNNCTREQSRRLEGCQRRAAIACTRAYNKTDTSLLLDELGWPTLQDRRTAALLMPTYKILHGMTPNYLRTLLPPTRKRYTLEEEEQHSYRIDGIFGIENPAICPAGRKTVPTIVPRPGIEPPTSRTL